MLSGNRPERFVLDNIQAKLPRFGAVLVEDFGSYDLQSIPFHQCFVHFHRMQLDEHASFDGLEEFLVFAGGEAVFLEPVGNGHGASRLQ